MQPEIKTFSDPDEFFKFMEEVMSGDKPDGSEGPLPDWAICKAPAFKVTSGQTLITRYPRQRGNATILDIQIELVETGDVVWIITGTDAGNVCKYTLNELQALYEPGPFIVKELCNPVLYEKLDEFRRNAM